MIGVYNDVNVTIALSMVIMNCLFNSLTTYLNLLADDINAVVYQCAMSIMGGQVLDHKLLTDMVHDALLRILE